MKWVLLLSPFYRGGQPDKEKLSNLSKVTQLVSSRARIQTHAVLPQSLVAYMWAGPFSPGKTICRGPTLLRLTQHQWEIKLKRENKNSTSWPRINPWNCDKDAGPEKGRDETSPSSGRPRGVFGAARWPMSRLGSDSSALSGSLPSFLHLHP